MQNRSDVLMKWHPLKIVFYEKNVKLAVITADFLLNLNIPNFTSRFNFFNGQFPFSGHLKVF